MGTEERIDEAGHQKATWGLLAAWTAIVALSGFWNVHQLRNASYDLATEEGRSTFNRDVLFRRWVAEMGGVYVPIDRVTPNPHLEVEHRDVTTTDGRQLTLVNPAYMTRMVYELYQLEAHVLGHITSLTPLRPENAPDAWERAALERFEAGDREAFELMDYRGEPHMRFMRAFITEQPCLKCHAHQGYEVGDVRGGVSVAVPMAKLYALERPKAAAVLITHVVLWLLGVFGISWASNQLQRDHDLALRASAAKGAFLANMSHEIRTPINGILGMAALLEDTPLDEEQRDSVRTIRASGSTLLRLMNDVLDFSKIEAGKLDLELGDLEAEVVVRDVVRLLRPQAKEKGVSLHGEIGPELPAVVRGDATRLRQVLLNLVSNAVKFTEQGSVVVKVDATPPASCEDLPETAPCSPDRRCVELRFDVIDTGIGIAPEHRDRLFQAFSQVDASTSRIYGGTGLGLAICKRLVELMRGSIGVESEVGKGSRFFFSVPTVVVDETPTGECTFTESGVFDASSIRAAPPLDRVAPPAPPPPAPEGPHLDLLLVEDHPVNRKVAGRMLERLGHRVEVAEDGLEALAALERRAFDLVFMDVQMPNLDGLAATRQLRERGHRVPIVAMTANAMPEDRVACLEAGMDDHLSKPIERAAIQAVLARWVGGIRRSL